MQPANDKAPSTIGNARGRSIGVSRQEFVTTKRDAVVNMSMIRVVSLREFVRN